MAKRMLIDAAHPEETRVVVMDGSRVEDFDFEVQNRKQLRGNIYLAKVTRVEPSLQAAFVEYGGNRHGFLAFSEIHPDYYQIPVADREALKAEIEAAEAAEDGDEPENGAEGAGEEDDGDSAEELRRKILSRRYKIQEVIRRRQVMLIQVVKEERGTKGAALTTYLSLAGRYCVLMPNTGRGGGISRKITNSTDRKRLKKVATDLDVPRGMGLIIRTAGAKRTKTEIKRDYEYLMRAWETIRDTTLRSVAPALIYEESSLVKRAIRDLYDKDVDEVHVEGDAAYREAKDFVRMLMPSHAKRVHQWKEPIPILTKHGAERELGTAFLPTVNLRSGGYIVINQTEALVAIDVNSGRATRERNIEQTALKTNLEAAEEAARQIRLRDLAGLIVIDFIDMEEAKNDRAVEKRMKDCLRFDRARIQMGKISNFGLLELSRQRRRTGILEGSSHVCPHCAGTGRQRSVESSSLSILRSLEESAGKNTGAEIVVRAATDVAFYVLNDKRSWLEQLEQSRGVRVKIQGSPSLAQAEFQIDVSGRSVDEDADLEEEPAQPRRSRSAAPPPPPAREIAYAPDEDEETPAVDTDGEGSGSRRRRGRRGGRRRENGDAPVANGAAPEARREKQDRPPREDAIGEGGGRRRPRRRRGRGRSGLVLDGGEHLDFLATDPIAVALPEPEPEPEPVMEPEHEPEPIVDATPEPVAPPRPSKRAPAAAAAPAPVAAPMAADGDEDDASTPEAADDAGAGVMLDQAQLDSEAYQPDQERRDRFFSRLRPWGKKNV